MTVTRIAAAALILAALAAPAAAVYDPNGSHNTGDGPSITSAGSSAGATVGVGPNGTAWRATVAERNATCSRGNHSAVADVAFPADGEQAHTVTFRGTVTAAHPCHTVQHAVHERGDGMYVLNVTATAQDGVCVQCVGTLTYDATFGTDDPFRLVVQHDGETVRTITAPGYAADDEDRSLVAAVMGWLAGLL